MNQHVESERARRDRPAGDPDALVHSPPVASASERLRAPGREWLSSAELAERLSYSRQHVYNLVSRGKLKLGEHYVKPGGKTSRPRFHWPSVERWLRDGQV
jgi:hypothetical protein